MSKQQLYTRLNRLFSEITENDTAPSDPAVPALVENEGEQWTQVPPCSPSADSHASLAIPFQYGLQGTGVLEIVDESGRQTWSEEERLLVQEVASQLALALENAQLYQTIQQELVERKRVEEEILRRNQDLAALTQIGQELSRLARQKDIIDILQSTVNQLVDGKNLVIALLDAAHKAIYYPIFIRAGQMQTNPDLQLTGAIVRFTLQGRSPLLINGQVREAFSAKGLELEGRLPASLLAIPMIAGDRPIGAILIENYESETAFSPIHLDLLSTVASQATIALENARLFGEIRTALSSIENRERYQSSVAQAVALFTESGSDALPEVLQILGQAAKTSCVYYANIFQDETGCYWNKAAMWAKNEDGNPLHQASLEKIPVSKFPAWASALEKKGWAAGSVNDFPEPESEFLIQQGVRSTLMLAVPGDHRYPGFIAFDQFDAARRWQNDEISILQVAADALVNTLVRENLLEQLQVSLEETENLLAETEQLYEISTGIAQAATNSDLMELLSKKALPGGAEQAAFISIHYSLEGAPLELELFGLLDESHNLWRSEMRLPISAFPIIHSIGSNILIYSDVEDSDLDRSSKNTLLQYQVKSACLLPLISNGRLNGILIAAASKPRQFDMSGIHVLEITASNFAVALERQRLLKEARRRASELQAAAEVARDTTSTLSLDILLERIVNQVITRFRFYHASIFLKEETGNYAVIRKSTGEAGRILTEREFKLAVDSKSLIGEALRTGTTITVNDVSRSNIYFPTPLLPDTRSEMALPLKLGSRTLGVLDIQSIEFNAFTNDDAAVLQILADQLAVGIDNARSYELVQQAVEDMREVDRMKSQFLANMSHELRTPLNSIIGFSKVILKGIDGPINEIQEQDLTAIYHSGQHLLNLINDVLDISKIEAGKMELTFSELDLHELVRSVMSTASGLVKDKHITLSSSVADNVPILQADNTRIRQVLLNLISNAAKFTDQGSIEIEAALSTSPAGQPEVMIIVTDTGPGIAEQDRHKLFQPFSQVDDSPTRKTGGTGLGLSICRSLIELHHGRIGLLESEVGKGSKFYFTLPLSNPINSADPVTPEHPSILCIDNDMQVIKLYERYLKPHGYQVVPVLDAKRAVEFALAVKPVAITLDVMMPERDGWHVLEDLKNNEETHHIPIIMCSILEEQEKGLLSGASDYLVKPFLQEDLIQAVERLTQDSHNANILVIDDDPNDLRLVKLMLEEYGHYQVTLAQGGNEGWEAVILNPPDVILLDLLMPELNGLALLDRLQSHPEYSKIPVIVLTGADVNMQQHTAEKFAGKLLLTKSTLRETDLLRALDHALNKDTQGS
jgi:signal transduction histidine kinase/CheY-like chemotaxis protein